MAQLHDGLKRMTARASRRVGRGGKRGKTSGRGGKGQTARAGHKIRPEWRDIIKKYPKRRGYGKNRASTVDPTKPNAVPVTIEFLEAAFENGAEVTLKSLLSSGVIDAVRGRAPYAKILGEGTLTKKLIIKGVAVSAKSKAIIEKAGGSVVAA